MLGKTRVSPGICSICQLAIDDLDNLLNMMINGRTTFAFYERELNLVLTYGSVQVMMRVAPKQSRERAISIAILRHMHTLWL